VSNAEELVEYNMADNVKHNIKENYTNLKRQRGEKGVFIQIISTVRERKCMTFFLRWNSWVDNYSHN